MNYSNKEIEKNLLKTATDPGLVDVIKDYSELGLEAIFNTELVEVIPVVRSVSAVLKGVATIQDRMFLKKLASFLTNANKMSIDERDAWYDKYISGDEKLEETIADKLLIMINAVNDNYKAEIIGKLFMAFVKGDVQSTEHFFYMTELVEGCFTDILKGLSEGREMNDEALFRVGIKHASNTTGGDIEEMLAKSQRMSRMGMSSNPDLPTRSASLTPAGELLVHVLRTY